MTSNRLFGIAIQLLVALSVRGQSVNPLEVVRETARDGLLVSVSTPQATFLHGDEIPLRITIKNPDGVSHMVHWNTLLSFLKIEVRGPIGEGSSSPSITALTEEGKKATAFQPDRGVHGTVFTPGREQTWTIELTGLFHMEIPGKYLLRVSAVSPVRGNEDGRRWGLSNEIQVFIAPR